MEAALTHLTEDIDLLGKGLLVQLAVPRPEGGAAVFRGGILKQALFQHGSQILFVKH